MPFNAAPSGNNAASRQFALFVLFDVIFLFDMHFPFNN